MGRYICYIGIKSDSILNDLTLDNIYEHIKKQISDNHLDYDYVERKEKTVYISCNTLENAEQVARHFNINNINSGCKLECKAKDSQIPNGWLTCENQSSLIDGKLTIYSIFKQMRTFKLVFGRFKS